MLPRLHMVTDRAVLESPGFEAMAKQVLQALGPDVALHLRAHEATGRQLFALAKALAGPAARAAALLLINDRIDVAMAAGAAGVHLGRRSVPAAMARRLLGEDAVVGISTHRVGEVYELGAGADFAFFGNVFSTASHPGRPPAGIDALRRAVASSRLPVIGIGGVTVSTVAEVLGAGAHGVAVLSGVWRSAEPVAEARRYLAALAQVRETRTAGRSNAGSDTGGHDVWW